MKRRLYARVFSSWVVTLALGLSAAGMTREAGDAARLALNHGRADEALRLLDAALRDNPSDAEAFNLRCRVMYAEQRWSDAIAACEQAVQLDPKRGSYHMWLGRAYGEQADRVNFVAAYKMAKLIHAEFESAASLDPHDGEALSDLGEYYVEAPVIVGGGTNKAEALAQQMEAFAPDRAHELRARIAEQKKDYAMAEREFRAKISAAAHVSQRASAQSWMDLGSFYRRRERWDDMLAALRAGSISATDHGSELVDGASTLIRAGRSQDMAAEWLKQYLDGNSLSEDAPAFVVHTQLGDLYKARGDARKAQKEYAEAHALASDFPGAQQGKTNTNR